MSYPEAYCVKCHAHTDTQQKHTVVLSNQARALTGVCPKCQSDVYRIMPPKKKEASNKDNRLDGVKAYPDAYCVKCQAKTSTVGKHTVVMQNQSRAMTGSCPGCGSQVYRIMPKARRQA
jgi:Zn finger protein HypA/HybF involved in hydrogenase expression